MIHEQEQDLAEPVIVGDRSGLVHLFWSDIPRTGEDTLYYSRLEGDTWTLPVDLFTGTNISGNSVAVDDAGILHLTWNDGIQLYYSQAPVQEALSASSWTKPLLLGNSLLHSQVVAGPNNQVFIVFPGLGSAGPVFIKSEDGGNSWSDDVSIAFTATEDTSADFTRLAVGPDGSLNVVWTEFQLPNGFPPTGTYYAKSSDGGNSWSKPVELAGGGFVQATIVATKSNELHVVWNGMAGVGGRYHTWSADGGRTWSSPFAVLPPPTSGTEGLPQLVIDSADNLHLLSSYARCPTYSHWQNHQWVGTTCLMQLGSQSSSSEEPAMTLTEGNRLHAVFWEDRKRLFYSTSTTTAPPMPLVPFPTLTPFPTPSPKFGGLAAIASPTAPLLAENLRENTQAPTLNPIWPVATSFAIVSLVIIIAIVLRFLLNKKRLG